MKLTFMSHIPSWRRGMNLEIIIQILSIYMWTIIILLKYKNIFDNHVLAVRTHLSLSSSTLASWPRRMNDDKRMKHDIVWKKPGITEDKAQEFVEKVLQYIVGFFFVIRIMMIWFQPILIFYLITSLKSLFIFILIVFWSFMAYHWIIFRHWQLLNIFR